jgi:hypothetical protein
MQGGVYGRWTGKLDAAELDCLQLFLKAGLHMTWYSCYSSFRHEMGRSGI